VSSKGSPSREKTNRASPGRMLSAG